MKKTQQYLISLLVLLFSYCGISNATASDQITLFIPAFEGPGELGKNVATILNLRTWSTFRRKPWPNNPDNLDFGKGLVIWDPNPLQQQSHNDAERQAKELSVLAQIVLWGKAYAYGDGVAVQANISIPRYRDFRQNQHERWQVSINGETLVADIPRRRFEVSSIILTQDIIREYSLPSSLKIYQKRRGGEAIATVGQSYMGIQFENQLGVVKIISGDKRGWVRLPLLAKQKTVVSTFTGALIKIFRSDWQGALSAMQRVIDSENIRTPLKIDAHLYAGLALEKMGKSGRHYFEQALALNAYASRTVRYLIMSDLALLEKMKTNNMAKQEITAKIEKTKALLSKNKKLFSANDEWFQQAEQIIHML